MAVTRQIPLGAAERVPDACAWTNSTREESFEPLVAHHLRLDTSSGPALRLLRMHTARVLTTQMPETRRPRLPRLHTCPQTSPADHSEIGRARIRISVLPQRQKAHSACCEATPTCGIKVHSLPQRATRCSRAAGSWHDPIRVECTRCSATGAALMRAVLACSRCAPKARHRQGHKPGPQRDCGPGMVASSMACDHGERTFSDRLRSPTPTWLTGPTKQLSRSARRCT